MNPRRGKKGNFKCR